MVLIVRGILWYGLYQFLIILPLLTAVIFRSDRVSQPLLVEIGVAAGFVGFALMALEFSLISRIKPAAEPFGEDSLQLFHNLMGIVALGFILAHPILLIIAGYPIWCWLNPLTFCANLSTRTAWLAVVLLLLLIGTSIWRKKLRLRYEHWQLFHGVSALVIIFSALVHIFVIGRYTANPIMKIVWLVYAGIVLGLIVRYKIWTPIRMWRQPWRVVENREERGDSRTLVLQPVGHEGFAFEAGQFAWLKTGRTPFGLDQHPISLSSIGDKQPDGSITFTIRNLGDWSGEKVPALQLGAELWIDGPHGVFTLERHQAMGFVFVAGGVGITPLYSMLQTMLARGDVRPIYLFYGVNDLAGLTFYDELRALAAEERENVHLIPVLANPVEDWEGETGFINAEVMQRYLPDQYRRFMYMICGPKPLMDAMEEALPALGVPAQNVLTERFDMV